MKGLRWVKRAFGASASDHVLLTWWSCKGAGKDLCTLGVVTKTRRPFYRCLLWFCFVQLKVHGAVFGFVQSLAVDFGTDPHLTSGRFLWRSTYFPGLYLI